MQWQMEWVSLRQGVVRALPLVSSRNPQRCDTLSTWRTSVFVKPDAHLALCDPTLFMLLCTGWSNHLKEGRLMAKRLPTGMGLGLGAQINGGQSCAGEVCRGSSDKVPTLVALPTGRHAPLAAMLTQPHGIVVLQSTTCW
jgi:hypothetical protein